MRVPDQRHDRLGAGGRQDLLHRLLVDIAKLGQGGDHHLALAGLRRLFDKGAVQPAFLFGLRHPFGG